MMGAAADPIHERVAGISSMAVRHALAELAEAYERRFARGVSIESVGGVEAARRVAAGEPLDFVVLAAEALGPLESAGRIVPRSRIDLASSGVAIAVKTGAAHPDVGDEPAVRRAVLEARTIGYSTGPSGAHLTRLFEKWGIAAIIRPRIVQAPPGVPVGSLVARGEVELGFQQLSELIHERGVEVVGPLPPAIQALTVFSGAVCAASTRRAAAAAFLSFAASADADDAKRRHGMEPARGSSPQ
ncbi:MAG: substrate-binding domain-containing protein [Usitatibacter sp.]